MWKINGRTDLAVEGRKLHVTHNSDDLDIHASDRSYLDLEPLADWVFTLQMASYQCFTDNRHQRLADVVGSGEVATGQLWDAHRAEVIGRDRPHISRWRLAVGRRRLIGAIKARADAGTHHRHEGNSAGALHARQCFDA